MVLKEINIHPGIHILKGQQGLDFYVSSSPALTPKMFQEDTLSLKQDWIPGMHARTCKQACTCTQVHTHVRTRMYTDTCMHARTCTHARTLPHTHIISVSQLCPSPPSRRGETRIQRCDRELTPHTKGH